MASLALHAPMVILCMHWSMSICMMRITDERLKSVKESKFNQLVSVAELGKNVMIKMHLVLNNMSESAI